MALQISMVLAFLKSVAMGYLLGAAAVSLASLGWRWLRPRLPGHLRAASGFALLTGALGLNAAFTLLICCAVVSGAMPMTTNFFHKLMYGGWAAAIVTGGWLLLGMSLAIGWVHWLRGRLPRHANSAAHAQATEALAGYGLPASLRARFTKATPSLCLVSVWRSELWIHPGLWESLSPLERELAVGHELCHLRRRDNLQRLVLEALSALYFALPWVRGWARDYELDAELAVDYSCRQRAGAAYQGLISRITAQQYKHASLGTAASYLSAQAQAERLRALDSPPQRASSFTAAGLALIGIVFSQVLAVLLLSHSVTRCLLTCFLGY